MKQENTDKKSLSSTEQIVTKINGVKVNITVNGKIVYNPFEHYLGSIGPTHEFSGTEQTKANIKNVGWTLGNDCPYRCKHCYSMSARIKGKDLEVWMVDRVVDQLSINGIATVNLGGNEPLFTNGLDDKNTLLPYIIERLVSKNIAVGLTTSGITLLRLYRDHRSSVKLLNDIDISIDSPIKKEHDENRGAPLFNQALEALKICNNEGIPHTCIMAAMNWNFTPDRIHKLVDLARVYEANVRINPVKPVEPKHKNIALPPDMYYNGFSILMEECDVVDLGEPPLASVTKFADARGCPCGRTSFRIHSITPNGNIQVSPCVYLHDYKSNLDLLQNNLSDIIASPQFVSFRQRHANPELIEDCKNCKYIRECRGGCTARSYLHELHETGIRTLLRKDPYCPRDINPKQSFPENPHLNKDQTLVHMDYLCTWIGKPREKTKISR